MADLSLVTNKLLVTKDRAASVGLGCKFVGKSVMYCPSIVCNSGIVQYLQNLSINTAKRFLMLLYAVHKCESRLKESCIEDFNFDLMFANSSCKVPMDGDKGDSRQGGKRCLGLEGQPGSWEDPLNDSANRRECTKDCLDGGIGPPTHRVSLDWGSVAAGPLPRSELPLRGGSSNHQPSSVG